MSVDNLYNEIFTTDDKAKAFDEIAKCYYDRNFGTMSKSDFEVLLFSIYIERILCIDDKKFGMYSDYELSKQLGITQSKVRNLKVKKQLQYPRTYDWKEAFVRVCENATYENGKIKVQIPDVNLYYEVKNAIEEAGGYIDISLTSNLLQVSPGYFLDLICIIADESEKASIEEKIQETLYDNCEYVNYIENMYNNKIDYEKFKKLPFGKSLAKIKTAGKILPILRDVLNGLSELEIITDENKIYKIIQLGLNLITEN